MIVEMKIINEKWQICFSNDFFSHSIGSIFYKLFFSQAARTLDSALLQCYHVDGIE
jgi:hypothetical protein